MAIFNAWCDRVPIADARRAGTDGRACSAGRGSTGSTPRATSARSCAATPSGTTSRRSVPAALEVDRARAIASRPRRRRGPIYVCLDAALQEELLIEPPSSCRRSTRFPAPTPADPAREAVARRGDAARPRAAAAAHDRPRVRRRAPTGTGASRSPSASARSCSPTSRPAPAFPRVHPLHPFPPSLYVTDEAGALIRDADVDPEPRLDRSRRHAAPGLRGRSWPQAKVIQCSLDQYSHNGWSMDYQALPPTDHHDARLARPAGRSAAGGARARHRRAGAASSGRAPDEAGPDIVDGRLSVAGDGADRHGHAGRAQSRPTSACRSAGRARAAASRIRSTTSASTAAAASAPGPAWRSAPPRAARQRPPARRGARRRRLSDGADGAVDRRALPHPGPHRRRQQRSRSSTTSCIRSGWRACAAGRSRIARSACA